MKAPARRRPLLVVLSGPSGVGKDAVLDDLKARGHRFHRVVTCTTRPPRPNEREGVDYHFLSEAEFDALVGSGGLLEHARVYGSYYGVPKQQVQEQLGAGVDVYVRTDVQGAASIKRVMPDAVRIFIAPASMDDLEARIRGRGSDDEEDVTRRLETARSEMASSNQFEYAIVNEPGRLDRTVDQLESILEAERVRQAPQPREA